MQTKKIYLATYWIQQATTLPMSGSLGLVTRFKTFETYAQAFNFTKDASKIQEVDFEYESSDNDPPSAPSFGGVFSPNIMPFVSG
jgi:hypothetical protein